MRRFALLAGLPAIAAALTPSTVTLTATPNPATYGQPVTMTAAVAHGATGIVTFYDGVIVLGTASVSSGQAVFATRSLTTGARSLRAYYPGDATYAPASSASLPQTVNSTPSFGLRHPLMNPAGGRIGALASADLNGDGKLDVLVARADSPGITVFLGNGDGTFNAGSSYTTADLVDALVIGDFNQDGKTDIAAGYRYTNLLTMLPGNGDGAFGAAINYPSIASVAMAAADFNGDGRLDLALASFDSSTVILLGNGDGSFSASIPNNLSSQYLLTVADLNGDGKPDLVTGFGNSLRALLGRGDGSFTSASGANINGPGIFNLVVGDFDNDGKPDVVADTQGPYGPYLLRGNGNGTFQTPVQMQFVTAGFTGSFAMAALDFDGDGNTDLLSGLNGGRYLQLLAGNGNGTFAFRAYYLNSLYSGLMVAGDFSGDGRVDVITADNVDNYPYFEVFLGGAVPDPAVSVARGTNFIQGQQGAAYTVTVTNSGDYTTSGPLSVVLSLPAGITATSLSGPGWTCVLADLACTRSDTLAAGASFYVVARVNVSPALTGNITASFTVTGGGDQNPANNTVTDTTFVRYSTVATLSAAPSTATLSSPITLTASLPPSATGVVAFYDGSAWLGSSNIAGGQAVFVTRSLPSGVRNVRASYQGDGLYGANTCAAINVTVNALPTNSASAAAKFSLGANSTNLIAADLNGDSLSDLIRTSDSPNGGVAVTLATAGGSFLPAVFYPVTSPSNVFVADFNSDGKADLLVQNSTGFALLTGIGNGTFNAAVQVSPLPVVSTLPQQHNSVAIGDFNGDGKPDLLAINPAHNPLYVTQLELYIGNGDGSFQSAVVVPTGSASFNAMLAADMNSDGRLDFILTDDYGSQAYVFLANGDGSFQAPLSSPPSPEYAHSWSVGDFNGDGKPDLAEVSSTGIAVFCGNGDGTLRAYLDSAVFFTPNTVSALGDFNGDGKLDIALGNYSSTGTVAIAFGNGDGTFQFTRGFATTFPVGTSLVSGLVIGDFNGDGHLDFAAANSDSSGTNVFVFSGGQTTGLNISLTHSRYFIEHGSASYQLTVSNPAFFPTAGAVTVVDTLPAGFAVVSISGVGWQCTLATRTCSRTDPLGSGASFPPIAISFQVPAPFPPTLVTYQATVDNTGVTNTATATVRTSYAAVVALSPTPDVTQGQAVSLMATLSPGGTGSVLFSCDAVPIGSAPVVNGVSQLTSRLIPSGLHALRATFSGDNDYGPAESPAVAITVHASPASGLAAPVTYPTGTTPKSIAMGDFNRDGKADLVVANSGANTVSVMLGNGDGTFAAKADYAVGTRPSAVAVVDFNLDGYPDIATLNPGSGDVTILLGSANGTFAAVINIPTVVSPLDFAVGDLDRDGRVDLVVSSNFGSLGFLFGNGDGSFRSESAPYSLHPLTVADINRDGNVDLIGSDIYYGNGDGTFTYGARLGSFPAIGLADLNGDGLLDLLTLNSSQVLVSLGTQNGTFLSPSYYPTGSGSNAAFAVADVNGDDKLDVIVTAGSGTIQILRGNGDGTLQSAVSYNAGTNPAPIFAGDFNGDGLTDLAIANSGSNDISVFLGIVTPILSVTSTHTGSFGLGQSNATYTLTVNNRGPGGTAGTVTLADTLPAGLTAAGITGTGWSCDVNTITCTRSDSLPAGQSYSPVTLTIQVTAGSAGTVSNSVSVSGVNAIGGSALDPTAIGIASLVITKSHLGDFVPGLTGASYKVEVSNPPGPVFTNGTVTVTESLPSGLTLVSMSGLGWTCVANVCTRNDSIAGGFGYPEIHVTVNVKNSVSSPQVNSVSVSGPNVVTATAADSTIVACTYALFGTGGFSAAAAQGSLTLMTSSLCSWTASTGSPWIHITSPTFGSGSGSLSFSVDANTSTWPRTGYISISGNPFTVTQGPAGAGLRFVAITPCRIADTRGATGPLGGPALAGGVARDFDIRSSSCTIPASALAYSLNLTVVPLGSLGFLSVWPAGQSQPGVSTLNAPDGRVKANAAIVPAGEGGAISLYASNTTNSIIDINGYFVPATGSSNLQFYPVTPCRVADTRGATGTFGGPALVGGATRSFPISGACGIPTSAQAFAVNFTVVPSGGLGFLSAWPAGQSQPGASTLNAPTGGITANAAIVPTGTSGAINLYASSTTHAIIDINGYFAPPSTGGMDFYTAIPCRIADTRGAAGPYGQPQLATSTARAFSVAGSSCGIPANGGAYSLNATVVPPAALGFLSLWGAGSQPSVSTLNAGDGVIAANAAIVPAGPGGSVTAYGSNATHLILDINGYFQ